MLAIPLPTPTSVYGQEVAATIAQAKTDAAVNPPASISVGAATFRTPFPSPEDWRDQWIYFLLIDRFNNPIAAPRHPDPSLPYQGGTFEGIRQQLDYIKGLGAGAIWISPVLMNPRSFGDYYGGYAAQDLLRIEPRFCSNPAAAEQNPQLADREFRALVDEIHAHGMYVVLDIVINHMGDLFNYDGIRDAAPWKGLGPEYPIYWRGGDGVARGNWTDIGQVPNLSLDAGVWPRELQRNDYFRRRGDVEGSRDKTQGDFGRLKELVTEYVSAKSTYPVRDILIRAHQYLIAKFDLDGFRVDTLMYVEREFARVFANAMREFALSIGKKNFFAFGEIWVDDDEGRIAEYIGRDTARDRAIVGFDAALDFPLRKRLEAVAKGVAAPKALADHLDYRQNVQRTLLSSHGDVGAYFVTFLENHDLVYRYATGCQDDQVTLALTCLFTLQGIPCHYYGTEQGLAGHGDTRESARECLWRDPGVFTRTPQHTRYQTIAALSQLRLQQPTLRYGRQYMRPVTRNDIDFGYSEYIEGVLAYSRILNDSEVVIVANCSKSTTVSVRVVVDRQLTPSGRVLGILFSNLSKSGAAVPGAAYVAADRAVVPVTLRPLEVQVLG